MTRSGPVARVLHRLFGRLLARSWGPAKADHLRLGQQGEREAAKFFKARGCRVLARNLQTPGGEADLVCLERPGGTVVLAEVKTRTVMGTPSGTPASAAINADKRRRLVRTANALRAHPICRGRPVRIDIVTVEYGADPGRRPLVTHMPNAVTADARAR